MSLNDEERKTVVELELEKADQTFEEIEILANAGRWSGAANRLYYAVFHAVNALLISDGHQTNTHKGSHAVFALHYIKTGLFPSEFGRLYNNLQTMRENSDYNCVYNVTEQEIRDGIIPARQLIEKIKRYIAENKK